MQLEDTIAVKEIKINLREKTEFKQIRVIAVLYRNFFSHLPLYLKTVILIE